MSARFFAWPAFGLALFFAAGPASAMSLSVANQTFDPDGYSVVLFLHSEGEGSRDASFSNCAGSCSAVSGWVLDVTFSEVANAGDNPFIYSGTITHEDGPTLSFSGIHIIAGGIPGYSYQLAHGPHTDNYGMGMGLAGGTDFFALTASTTVPEPAAALLVGIALVGVQLRFRKR